MSSFAHKDPRFLPLLFGMAFGAVLSFGVTAVASEDADSDVKNHGNPGSALKPTLMVYVPPDATVLNYDDGSMMIESCGLEYSHAPGPFPRAVALDACTKLFGDGFEDHGEFPPQFYLP